MADRPQRRTFILMLLGCLAACSPFSRDDGPPRRPPAVVPPDAVPQAEPRSARGNPPFYDVFGKRYHVLDSSASFRERGVASWYGNKFHGASTASGEPYDMHAMTAAHPTLPLPTYARVTNLRNGRSVVVRINDRGPFAHNRAIDLSYAAASRLDMLANGTTLVEIEALDPGGGADDTTARAAGPPPRGPMYVQVGAFGDSANAERLRQKLAASNIGNVVVRKSDGLYRVRVGPIPDVAAYDRTVAQMQAMSITDSRLVIE
ncbi:septal ring lytic transglycosylase RlpA family protein [soil metagenome]